MPRGNARDVIGHASQSACGTLTFSTSHDCASPVLALRWPHAGPMLAPCWPCAGPQLAPLALRRPFAMQRYALKLPAYR